MTQQLTEGAVTANVAALRAAIDGLLESDVDRLDAAEFAALLSEMEVQRRRLDAVDVRLLAAANAAHVAAQHCRSSLADLLVHELRVAPGVARARVRRAGDLGPRCSLLGEPLEPLHPLLSAAQATGDISTQHIDVATGILGRIPTRLADDATTHAEAFLLTAAHHEHPLALARTGHLLLERLDPDGPAPTDDRNHACRHLRLHRRADGLWNLTGSLTEDTGLIWQSILDTLSAPAPACDGDRDPRTAEQRTHDGLRDLGIRLLRGGVPTDAGNAPVTILIRTTDADLTTEAGLAQTDHGHLIRLASLTALCGDAELVPLTFDRAWSEQQLMLGRSRRLATRAQRRALTARDGGCSFPGCDRPATWCEVHHITEWARGGPTDIDNLCLLCPFHHREFERRGWAVHMRDGLPHWTAPVWIDPERNPRRNTAHHLPAIVLDSDGTITAIAQDAAPPQRP